MKRRRFTERQVIESLAWQGIFIACFRCQQPFLEFMDPAMVWLRAPEREHLHELALGGPDTPKNCRYGCVPCHRKATNGTKATSVGSSKHRIAKTNRIAAGGRKRRGKPIKSQGFNKKLRRKFSGVVEKR